MALPCCQIRLPMLSCLTLLCGMFLQGCNVSVPRHSVGNWESKPNYLTEFQHVPAGKPTTSAMLNSCNDKDIAPALQCGGHGKCRDWNDMVMGANPKAPKLAFCECNRDYADPECRTPRKSQLTAFVFSLFLGIFGADQFYLGYPLYGVAKLLTVGGCGIWYLYDLCRIGSSPVLTRYNFRVAADLPHFAFVLTVVTAMLFFGFAIAIRSIQQQRVKKAHELLLLRLDQQEAKEEEEEQQPPPTQPQYSMRQPTPSTTVPFASANFSGYGAMIPRTDPMMMSRPAPMAAPMTMPPTSMAGPMTLPPVTLPSASRSFTPPVTVPVMTLPHPVMAGPMTGPVVPTVTLPSMSSMPPTEYSIPRATVTSPRSPTSSPVLPVVRGFSGMVPTASMGAIPGTQPIGIRPVSSTINMPSQAPGSPRVS